MILIPKHNYTEMSNRSVDRIKMGNDGENNCQLMNVKTVTKLCDILVFIMGLCLSFLKSELTSFDLSIYIVFVILIIYETV